MKFLTVFFRNLIGTLLPKNRLGDKIYSFINFAFKLRRFPTNKMIFNDVLYRMKTSDEILDSLRVFVTDKEYAKIYLKAIVSEDYIVPTIKIFRNFDEITNYNFPDVCCIKPTHLSGEFIFKTQNSTINYEKIKKWFFMNHYFRAREANYKFLKPKVIVEPLIFNSAELPLYRFFCYLGKPKLIIADGKTTNKNRLFDSKIFDIDWKETNFTTINEKLQITKPTNLTKMLSLAEKISSDFNFARIDFFTDGKKCYISEITHIHANAMQRFLPAKSGEIDASKMIFG